MRYLSLTGQSAIKNLLDVPDHSILKGLLHIAKEGQTENKLLMTELLTELVISGKYIECSEKSENFPHPLSIPTTPVFTP